MPVRAVEGGFRWGTHGKVYKTRGEAERQAAAIYASGWREDSPRGRRAKRELHVALSANAAAEARYTRDMVAIVRGVHRGVLSLVDEHLGHERSPRKEDLRRADAGVRFVWNALRKDWQLLPQKIAKHLRPRVGAAFDQMAKRVNDKGARASTLIGIHPNAPGVLAAMADARENNIRLITDTGGQFLEQVRDVLTDPDNEGLRVEEVRDLLHERAEVSLSRATLIAVDQTLKLASNLNQHRQRAAGIDSYRWSTSKDERVRPMHAELEGQTFSWDDPPETNDDGDTNHPGEDYRCRCVALPVTSDQEVDEASAEESPDDIPLGEAAEE